jgi:hypothetical protein
MFGGSNSMGPLEVLKPNDRSGSNRVDPMSMGHVAWPCRSRITAVDRLNQQRHLLERERDLLLNKPARLHGMFPVSRKVKIMPEFLPLIGQVLRVRVTVVNPDFPGRWKRSDSLVRLTDGNAVAQALDAIDPRDAAV